MEPLSTTGAALARFLSAIKEFPLWLLVAAAVTFILVLEIPGLGRAIPNEARSWVLILAVLFTALAGCRFVSILISTFRAHLVARETRRTFHLTPIAHECRWGGMQQRDGSMTTQISGGFMAKNRTDAPLYLLKVRLAKPRFGELIQETLLIQSTRGREYGSAHVSGNFIPPGAPLPVAITLLFKGLPRRTTGDLNATLSFADEEGNEQRVKLTLKPFNPAQPVGKVA
jgi:hypothetical protein